MRRLTDVLVFVGPSGSGKSTLINHLLERWPQHFGFCTSHTTRQPRLAEVAGKHYHFVSRETFRHMINSGAFVEYNKVFSPSRTDGARGSSNNDSTNAADDSDDADYYGTTKKELYKILNQDKVVLMDLDIAGAMNIKKYCNCSVNGDKQPQLRVKVVFLKGPGLEVIAQRLRQRGTESDASLQKRLRENEKWLNWCLTNPNFFNHTLLNRDLETCLAELRGFVATQVLSPASAL
ncbi:guanylate kinase [Trypanosoma grayi]|uniref:guanylate kinase n=1 Tax=Trypanosoma grayi TaxID=71804 RepID=UPI0004F4550F|nr:guanylate kinase [Trypanosoma grayi]KEG13382.1 guanylate kinase [Trypanosoma grayi]